LSKIDRVENRIRQIEKRIEQGPQINSAAFNKLMAGHSETKETAKFGTQGAAMNKLNNMSHFNLTNISGQTNYSGPGASVKPLAQSNGVSCGQTSVAMCLNSLTGSNLTDMDIDSHYGFQLLEALKNESRPAGYDWKDAGNVTANSWSEIDRKVNQEKLPVIVALNGPEFSPSGRGHIVTIVKTEGDTVTYADPAKGILRTTSKQNINNAPSHPDGNFLFMASRVAPEPVQMPPYAATPLPQMGLDGML
jgi:Peptidase_C39 like family